MRVGSVTVKMVAGLVADTTITTMLGGAKVHTRIPEDTSFPFLHVRGGGEHPWAEATDGGGRLVHAHVDIWSAHQGTKEVDDLATEIERVLVGPDGGPRPSMWSGLTGLVEVRFFESPEPIDEQVGGLICVRRRVSIRVFLC